MGRPLYSSTFRTIPAVRDLESPSCEKWSYLNAFDPDSDEFFDDENAVYEDFIDPISSMHPEEEEEEERDMLIVRMGNASPTTSETSFISSMHSEEEEEEERDMLIVRMGNASPITSEGSLSDSDSPLAVGAEDPDLVAAFHDIRQIEEGELAPVVQDPAVRVRLATRTLPGEVRWGSQITDSGRSRPRRGFSTAPAVRTIPYLPYSQRDESLPLPAPSAPIPVPAVSRRSATFDERVLSSPSTPPRQTPMTYLPMSPPPASTPRLYSWARNPSHPASPSSGGPFTNPHARTSYAHLSPALIRIRDVTV